MDADGNCLVVSPCNFCKNSKNGVQSCIARRHNARLSSIKKTDLASRHRQCVKPDQAMTIFKLVDRDSGEESVEFARGMVFQRPCEACTHLKTCILGGHVLQDWTPDGGHARQNKRKSSQAAKSPKVEQPKEASSADSTYAAKPGAAPGQVPGPVPAPCSGTAGALVEGAKSDEREEKSRSKRRKAQDCWVSAKGGSRESATGTAGAASASTAGMDVSRGGGASATPQSTASQLEALAVEEDLLRQQYLADLRLLDEAEAAKISEIRAAHAALENIRLARKTKQSSKDQERKKMAAERERLTQLRLQEMLQEEAERQKKNEALWGACETSANLSTDAGVEAAVAAAMAAAAAAAEGGMETASERTLEAKEESEIEGQSQTPNVRVAGAGDGTGAGGGGGLLSLPASKASPASLASPPLALLNGCSPPSATLEGDDMEAMVEEGGVEGVSAEFDVVNSWALLRGGQDGDGGAVNGGVVVQDSGDVVERGGEIGGGLEADGAKMPDISDDDVEDDEEDKEGEGEEVKGGGEGDEWKEGEEEETERDRQEEEKEERAGGEEEVGFLDVGATPTNRREQENGRGRGASDACQESRLTANGWQARQEEGNRKGTIEQLSVGTAAGGCCTPAQGSTPSRRKEGGGAGGGGRGEGGRGGAGGSSRAKKEYYRHDEKEFGGGERSGRIGESGGAGGSGRTQTPRSGEDVEGGRAKSTAVQGAAKKSGAGGGRSKRQGGRHAPRHGGRTVPEAVSA